MIKISLKLKPRVLLVGIFFLLQVSSFGATITSTVTGGAWNAGGSWVGGVAPVPADDVIIATTLGNSITLTTNRSCNTLVINTGAILNLNTNNRTLTVAGAVTVNGSGIINFSNTNTTLSVGTNLTLNGTSTIQGVGTTRALNVTGSFSVPVLQTPTVQDIALTVTSTTQIDGTLTFNTGNTAAKTFTGSLTISNTGTFTNTSQNVPISIGGDLIVSGSGTFSQGTGRVTFTGASSNLVSCSNPIAFGGGITVNKGVSQANIIDMQGVITMVSGGLTLTNGTFKLSSASTITPFNSDPNFGATAQLWCNGGTMQGSNTTVTYAGAIQVTAGTLTVGTSANNYLYPKGGSLTISGGALNVAGPLSDSPAGGPLGMNFNMSAGTCTVATATGSTIDYPFLIQSSVGSLFTMTGGTLIIQNLSDVSGLGFSANAGYYNQVTGGTFTGGTLQIGNASTAASSTIEIDTTIPIYNLTVNNSTATARVAAQAITVSNNVTISLGTLNANSFNISVGGNWTNNGTFVPGAQTVTLNGTAAQTISGTTSTTFNNLTLNNAFATIPSIILGIATTATNTLTMTSGIVDQAGFTFTLGASGAASTLTRTGSTTTNWMYGGTFRRFWPTATAITLAGNSYGL